MSDVLENLAKPDEITSDKITPDEIKPVGEAELFSYIQEEMTSLSDADLNTSEGNYVDVSL